MHTSFKDMDTEPVKSIHIVELKQFNKASQHRAVYLVIFNITVKGHGGSMMTGRYEWTYDLSWDEHRHSWLITNYGAG